MQKKVGWKYFNIDPILPSLLLMLDLLFEKQRLLQKFGDVSQMWRGPLHALDRPEKIIPFCLKSVKNLSIFTLF